MRRCNEVTRWSPGKRRGPHTDPLRVDFFNTATIDPNRERKFRPQTFSSNILRKTARCNYIPSLAIDRNTPSFTRMMQRCLVRLILMIRLDWVWCGQEGELCGRYLICCPRTRRDRSGFHTVSIDAHIFSILQTIPNLHAAFPWVLLDPRRPSVTFPLIAQVVWLRIRGRRHLYCKDKNCSDCHSSPARSQHAYSHGWHQQRGGKSKVKVFNCD
ncbi:hypothetical protein EI94DRAFT_1745673 [Lactarius quietus]|nr:hypothetical protein EI94DRAFT_1745673 [Lactarius quietus]